MVSKYRSTVIDPRGEDLSQTLFVAVALFVSTVAVLAIIPQFKYGIRRELRGIN